MGTNRLYNQQEGCHYWQKFIKNKQKTEKQDKSCIKTNTSESIQITFDNLSESVKLLEKFFSFPKRSSKCAKIKSLQLLNTNIVTKLLHYLKVNY